jgi:Carboxypeptidase regulatory-like domain
LPAGPSILRAQLAGFESSEFRTALASGNNLWDTGLELGRIAATPERVVSGTVASATGDPIEGATVSFFSAVDTIVRQQVRTDKRGKYSFTTYGAGQYVITLSIATTPLQRRPPNSRTTLAPLEPSTSNCSSESIARDPLAAIP